MGFERRTLCYSLHRSSCSNAEELQSSQDRNRSNPDRELSLSTGQDEAWRFRNQERRWSPTFEKQFVSNTRESRDFDDDEMILSLWTRFLQSLSQTSDELTHEHLQIFLVLFHQWSLTQRTTVLLELVQIMSKSKENLYFLLLLDSWMFHFDEIPAEMIEQMQQILVKTTGTTQLDGFGLKTLEQSPIYHSFYTYLVEQLDFTVGTEQRKRLTIFSGELSDIFLCLSSISINSKRRSN